MPQKISLTSNSRSATLILMKRPPHTPRSDWYRLPREQRNIFFDNFKEYEPPTWLGWTKLEWRRVQPKAKPTNRNQRINRAFRAAASDSWRNVSGGFSQMKIEWIK